MNSDVLMTMDDFKVRAHERMDEFCKTYFSAGAGSKTTPPFNEDALQKYFLRPRMLRDVADANLHCQILNGYGTCPIGVAPTAMHSLVHPDGEMATAAGCYSEKCIYIMSSNSSKSIEEITHHESPPNCIRWMQIYIHRDRQSNLELIRRAEAHGFSALVVTVDAPVSGLFRDVLNQSELVQKEAFRKAKLPTNTLRVLGRKVTFEEIKWLKEISSLPVVVKGILCGKDAIEAVRAGASAVYVSNHGGRFIRRVIPTVHVLEEIVEAVKGVDVYLDGGIRSGSDIFVALALGAKAVFVGRPVIWGLCVDGEKGVARVLNILKDELLRTMQLSGVANIEDIKKCMIEKIE